MTHTAADRLLCLALLLGSAPLPAVAQSDSGRVKIIVQGEHRSLSDVEVRIGRLRVHTDRAGTTTLRLPEGPAAIALAHIGFRAETLHVNVRAGLDTAITTELVEQSEELATVVVTTTRVAHQVEDEPTRVEVLGGEEIEEKTQTRPGNLTQLMLEMSGVRVQPTAPAFGSASVRIQGLPGQYTRVLTDGLPLLGAQFGELSLTQVPPLDLQRAEVIKGASTALYGPSALSGVVNLVSRPPTNSQDFVLNQTSQSGSDGLAWLSKRWGDKLGLTLLGGAHRQTAEDVNGDGWADVAGFRRIELRPRLYWNSGRTALLATVGGMTESREGGTLPGALLPNGEPFPTAANTNRLDGGLVGTVALGSVDTLTLRTSATSQWGRQDFGPTQWFSTQRGRHQTIFSEATLTIPHGRATWLAGVGFEQDAFHSPDLPGFDYTFNTPSVFAQTTVTLSRRLATTVSGRCDDHSEYGTFCSPRISLLWRPGAAWSARISGATGFFAPTPFIEETEGIPLARLVPFSSPTIATCTVHLCANDSGAVGVTQPFAIRAERARYASLDITRRAGAVDITATVFGSVIEDPLILSDLNIFDDRPQLMNATGPTRTAGAELFAVYAHEPLVFLVEYAYMHSTTVSPLTGGRIDAPLTPRHSGGIDVAWESDETKTRVALHVFYTGAQQLLEDPYRQRSLPYATVGLLVSQHVGPTEIYVSGENLGNVRQTHYDPLLTLGPGSEVRWTTEQWAPLEGRVINAGIRLGF